MRTTSRIGRQYDGAYRRIAIVLNDSKSIRLDNIDLSIIPVGPALP
jgi:hypothetical protein